MVCMATLPDSPLTEEQYLQIEREAETKSEFHDGRMFGMSGGSPNHLAALELALVITA